MKRKEFDTAIKKYITRAYEKNEEHVWIGFSIIPGYIDKVRIPIYLLDSVFEKYSDWRIIPGGIYGGFSIATEDMFRFNESIKNPERAQEADEIRIKIFDEYGKAPDHYPTYALWFDYRGIM